MAAAGSPSDGSDEFLGADAFGTRMCLGFAPSIITKTGWCTPSRYVVLYCLVVFIIEELGGFGDKSRLGTGPIQCHQLTS